MSEPQALYRRRFEGDLEFRGRMWEVLCSKFFQGFVPVESAVLEIGAGYCEFINNIHAKRKIAFDLNPDTKLQAADSVEVVLGSSTDMSQIGSYSLDVVFASNFFEHLSREDIKQTLREIARVLRIGGRLLILQPNIRYCVRDYWQFFDHITPLDDRSLSEVVETSGFRVTRCIRRFLPFTTKGRLPNSVGLLKLYLMIPLAWRFLGQQSFLVAERIMPEAH